MLNTIIASIIMFGILIFAHEFGHFIVAKWARIKVLEFAIGFGKELIGWQRGATRFTLRIVPLGGFCRLFGEDPEEAGGEGSFQSKPLGWRFAVISAGSLFNFLLGALLLTLLYFFFLGAPQTDLTRIGEVLPEGRAYEAGLKSGDKILAINNNPVQNWDAVVSKISAYPEEEITMLLERDGKEIDFTLVPAEQEGLGRIGIAPVFEKYAFFTSIYLGFSYTWFFIQLVFVSLFQMIAGTIPADVAGPVGIGAVVGEVMQEGLSNLLSLAAIISINLGIINLLPIPALDGSRLVFLALEGIRGKPVDPQKEGFIHFIGFALLMMLMIFIIFQDISRLV